MPARDWFIRALVGPLDSRMQQGAVRNAQLNPAERREMRLESAAYLLTKPQFQGSGYRAEDLLKAVPSTPDRPQ
jgi:hypothetical protein